MREAPPACFQTQKQCGPTQGRLRVPAALSPHEALPSLASWGPRRAWVFAFPPTEGEVKPNILTGVSGPLHNWTFLFVQMLFARQHLPVHAEGASGEGEGWFWLELFSTLFPMPPPFVTMQDPKVSSQDRPPPPPIFSAVALSWSTYVRGSEAHFLSCFTDAKTPTRWKKWTWWQGA